MVDETKEKLDKNYLNSKKISRREALSTAGKVAVGVIVAGVVAGIGGYYAGSTIAPEKVVTKTVTKTKTVTVGTTTAASLPTGKKFKLTIMGPSGWTPVEVGRKLTPEFSEYARKNLGIEVEVTWDLVPFAAWYEKTSTALAAHSPEYDILYSDSQWLGAFAEAGHILKLNDFIEKDPKLKAIVDGFYKQHRWAYMTYPYGSENYWGLPVEADDLVLYVRKDLLNDPKEQEGFEKQYGWKLPSTYEDFVDLTWDKFENVLEWFTRPDEGFYGIAMEYSKEYDFISDHVMSLIWTLGGDIFGGKEPCIKVDGYMNSPQSVEALKYYRYLLKYQPPGAADYGIDQCITAISEGKVFSTLTWAAVGAPIFDPEVSKVADKVMVVLPPGKIVDGKFRRIYCIGGQPWVVSAYSQNIPVVLEFLKWWYSDEVQWKFARMGGLPPNRAVIDSDEFKKIAPWSRAFVDQIPNTRDFWHLPEYAELLLVQQELWHDYCSGKYDVEEAKKVMDMVAERQEKILKKWGHLYPECKA